MPRLKMSQSPRDQNEDDVPATTQSPAENEQPAGQEDDQNDGNMSRPEDIGYDFEVKEQDRWLPIANGQYPVSL